MIIITCKFAHMWQAGTRVVASQNAPRLDSETKKSKGGWFSLFRRRENDDALR